MKHYAQHPCPELSSYIHSFWELKGSACDSQWERIFPDGCPGIIINAGDACKTDNGHTILEHGKTYVVGAMTSFKDSFIATDTHLIGVCFKPAAFSSFFKFVPQHELTNLTVEFDKRHSLDIGKISSDKNGYLNRYFWERKNVVYPTLQPVLEDIHRCNGNIQISEMAKRNFITTRQLERLFKTHIGLTPKEYVNIIRFQSALSMINDHRRKSLSDIAFDCGFYDQAHLTNEMKRHTGLTPAEI
ncbi:DUF6597 domain-containing transcriptional factor [Chitinophaga sp. Hz27]|uniref:AraC family transcriptional regulator n=1 Tax=Chitinophaga sp. Hz27 TaxID=3347169 RepID=UPI0035DC111E